MPAPQRRSNTPSSGQTPGQRPAAADPRAGDHPQPPGGRSTSPRPQPPPPWQRPDHAAAFALGLFCVAFLGASGRAPGLVGWLRGAPPAAAPEPAAQAPMGEAEVLSDCAWVRRLTRNVDGVEWDDSMAAHCGKHATVRRYDDADRRRGVVLLRHRDGAELLWPVAATSIAPEWPPAQWTLPRMQKARAALAEARTSLAEERRRQVRIVLRAVGLETHLERMLDSGLDRAEILSSASPSDVAAAGIPAADWALISEAAGRLLRGEPVAPPPGAEPREPAPSPAPRPVALAERVRLQGVPLVPKGKSLGPLHPKTAHFIHVPKAGGTAFTAAIRHVVGCTPEACLGWPKDHAPCPQLAGCFDHDPLTRSVLRRRESGEIGLLVTTLRRPVDRVVSAYHHGSREWPCCGLPQFEGFKKRLYKKELDPRFGPRFTIASFAEHTGARNCVAKMLVGMQCKEFTKNVTAEQAAEAAAVLQRFDVVLLQEYVQDSLRLLSCVTGVPLDQRKFASRVRAGGYSDKGSGGTRATVLRANKWDQLVYERGVARFCQIWRDHACPGTTPACPAS
eukprot:TRINITY_DN1058_c7_g1_i1.p1 TRINITY_DN1058_c7_g1~~TRINITY_DN1058_c7_g1_i1.p1  ORF type:complete len:564 (+),score=144.32 TRINITY_DN1058_c7_g1_i1:67-1758(+)